MSAHPLGCFGRFTSRGLPKNIMNSSRKNPFPLIYGMLMKRVRLITNICTTATAANTHVELDSVAEMGGEGEKGGPSPNNHTPPTLQGQIQDFR